MSKKFSTFILQPVLESPYSAIKRKGSYLLLCID